MTVNEKILVTGANGFIGRQLCQSLVNQGYFVRAALRRPTQGPWDESVIVDFGDTFDASALCEGISCIFHLASKVHDFGEGDEADYQRINVEGTRQLLNAGSIVGVERFIFFSTVAAADVDYAQTEPQDESCVVAPTTFYGQSKLAAEQLLKATEEIKHRVILRPCMVYGPNDVGNMTRMIQAIDKGRFPAIPEVNNRRSMVHASDLVDAATLSMKSTQTDCKTYIVADGVNYSTKNIYDWIRTGLGKKQVVMTVPLWVLTVLGKVGDIIGKVRGRPFIFDSQVLLKLLGSAQYRSDKIATDLGFVAKNNLRQSMDDIIKAYRENLG